MVKGKKKKILPANAGDTGWIPGLTRSPGEENSNPLQYSCLGNPMDRGACWATVHEVKKKLDTIEHLTHKHTKLEKYSNNNKNYSV